MVTLEAVSRTESGLDPWTLHDNTTGVSEKPAEVQGALNDATAWIGRGDSVDIGLMQINAANFSALGLTVRAALDACASLAGGAALLQAAYGGGQTTAEQQVALLMALSRYNTGSPFKGIMNGYAHAVMVNAGTARLTVPSVYGQAATSSSVLTDPNAPPSWDVSAAGAYAETHGAPWLVSFPSSGERTKHSAVSPGPAAAPEAAANVVALSSTEPTMRSP